jgi:hypothetical protein
MFLLAWRFSPISAFSHNILIIYEQALGTIPAARATAQMGQLVPKHLITM